MTDAHPKVPSKDTLYCHLNKEGEYRDFYASRMAVHACGVPPEEVIRVRLLPDDAGTHWCWHDYERDEYCFVWPSITLLAMCFGNGMEAEEKRDRGMRTRVRVEELAA